MSGLDREKQRERQRRYRQRHPDRVRELNRRYREENAAAVRARSAENARKLRARGRAFIEDVKADGVCADCGGAFPNPAMDFDHVRGEKYRDVAAMTACAIDRIKEEIAKCDLVCANCHRVRHWAEDTA